MKRLLLYVHYNKYNQLSKHVVYQLKQMKPLFETVIFISNSVFSGEEHAYLEEEGLIDGFIQRENQGYDFAAWRDGFNFLGFDCVSEFDSVTLMNDTCFGPLWEMSSYYETYEKDSTVDFWGMTNHGEVDGGSVYLYEHLQSYFISFKKSIIKSDVFQTFWKNVKVYQDVQKVINEYEIQYTKLFVQNGFNYKSVLNTVPLVEEFHHYNFSIHYPHVLLRNRVPFIKVKTFDLVQHLSPYVLKEIEQVSDYPVDLIVSHMSNINLPTPAYLLDHKVLKDDLDLPNDKKVAVHLHTFYTDLLEGFLDAFRAFDFSYDLYVTTDTDAKKVEIEKILKDHHQNGQVILTGNKGRDIIPMLKLKDKLEKYHYIGHFHTKKSPEYPYWVGDSWRNELFEMLLKPANKIMANFAQREDLGLVIADVPSFFRYTKIVEPWNEFKFAEDMNMLWERMELDRAVDFKNENTFIMSYGTFIWFKYDALKPLFELNLTDEEIPDEPLPQHTILHSIERILVYLAWANHYDYAISQTPLYLTPFIDNRVLNIRSDNIPNTFVDFNQIGGIKGALKYIIIGPGRAVKYIFKRLIQKVKA